MTRSPDIQKAFQLARKGQSLKAISLLKRIVMHIEDAEAWYLLGCLLPTRRERINCLRQALRIDSSHASAQRQLKYLLSRPGYQPSQPVDIKNPQGISFFRGMNPLLLRTLIIIACGIAILIAGSGAGVSRWSRPSHWRPKYRSAPVPTA